jgi:hypothetical protein
VAATARVCRGPPRGAGATAGGRPSRAPNPARRADPDGTRERAPVRGAGEDDHRPARRESQAALGQADARTGDHQVHPRARRPHARADQEFGADAGGTRGRRDLDVQAGRAGGGRAVRHERDARLPAVGAPSAAAPPPTAHTSASTPRAAAVIVRAVSMCASGIPVGVIAAPAGSAGRGSAVAGRRLARQDRDRGDAGHRAPAQARPTGGRGHEAAPHVPPYHS